MRKVRERKGETRGRPTETDRQGGKETVATNIKVRKRQTDKHKDRQTQTGTPRQADTYTHRHKGRPENSSYVYKGCQ